MNRKRHSRLSADRQARFWRESIHRRAIRRMLRIEIPPFESSFERNLPLFAFRIIRIPKSGTEKRVIQA